MGIPDGAHTHGSGGSGLGPVVLVILAVALLGPAVAAAAAELLHLLVIVAVALAAVVAATVAAFIAYRLRHRGTATLPARAVYTPPQPRAIQGHTQPRAFERPAVHLHFHGVNAEDVAEILRRQLP